MHNFNQKLQTLGCYLFPIKMGDLLSKLRVIWKVITKVWYNDVIDINVSKNYIGSGLRCVY